MQKKKKSPFLWVILVILIFIFAGIMVDNHHFNEERIAKLDTSQSELHKDSQQMLLKARAEKVVHIPYDLAYQAFTKENYLQSYKALLPFALSGDLKAILVIGYLYEFGKGVKKDLRTAALWYYLGLQQNSYNKQAIQRGTHAYNTGDYKMAAEWFRMADELRDRR